MINVFVFVCVFLEGSRISDEVPDRLCPRLDVSGRLFYLSHWKATVAGLAPQGAKASLFCTAVFAPPP